MENNPKSKFKLIYNKNFLKDTNKELKNNDIENLIISAATSKKNSEVTVYFKNIPAYKYNMGYEKFCGLKINNLVFYNDSLFNLYPNLLDFLYFEYSGKFLKSISKVINSEKYFSINNIFKNSKLVKNTNLFVNLNISFNEILQILDTITEFIYDEKILNVLILSSIKK